MKRTSALALFTVAAMGLSACGSEDSNDAADSGSSASASAQQKVKSTRVVYLPFR